MKINKLLGFCLLLTWMAFHALHAQTYPNKPITIVVPFPPGGPTDSSARLIGKGLSNALGQAIVIDNRGGAGGTVGTAYVARANADGYTLLWAGTSSLVVAPALYNNLAYDPVKSFQPIGMVVRGPMVLAAKTSLAANNLNELMSMMKSQKLSFASAGQGSIGHLTGELFQDVSSVNLLHVPYRGGAPALTDLLSGQVDLIFETAQFMSSNIKAGKAKAFVVFGAKRYPGLPEVATMNELLGKNSFEAYSWFGLAAPAGTPSGVVQVLDKALQKTMGEAETRNQLEGSGFEMAPTSAEFLSKAIENDLKTWRDIVARKNIKPE